MGGAGYEPAETPLWRQLLSYTIAGGLSLTIVGILLWDRHQRLSKLELELEKQVRTKNVIGNTTPDKTLLTFSVESFLIQAKKSI